MESTFQTRLKQLNDLVDRELRRSENHVSHFVSEEDLLEEEHKQGLITKKEKEDKLKEAKKRLFELNYIVAGRIEECACKVVEQGKKKIIG